MVRRFQDDPDTARALDDLDEFKKSGGKLSDPGALDAWRVEKRREDEERERERAALGVKAYAEEKARQERYAARERTRYTAPEGYTPPTSLAELEERVERGEAFFEGAVINGKGERTHVDLAHCNLRNSSLSEIDFSHGSSLDESDLQRCAVTDVTFGTGCTVRNATFDFARFDGTKFKLDCEIQGASFKNAHFLKLCMIEFDQNTVLHATFKMPKNRWQRLVSSYTGVQQFLNLAFSLAYLTILMAKIFAFGALAEMQSAALDHGNLRDILAAQKPPIEPISVWQVVFGGGSSSYLSMGVAFLVLTYQIARFFITTRISPLIEDQKIDGRTPTREAYENFRTLHSYVSWFGWLVFALFAVDLYSALSADIYLSMPSLSGLGGPADG